MRQESLKTVSALANSSSVKAASFEQPDIKKMDAGIADASHREYFAFEKEIFIFLG